MVYHPLIYSCLPNLFAVDVDSCAVVCSDMQLAVFMALDVCVHSVVVVVVSGGNSCANRSSLDHPAPNQEPHTTLQWAWNALYLALGSSRHQTSSVPCRLCAQIQ
eukprot:COSAG02_NODE_235_length_27784_cov_9.895828_19_plen_105_part_00